MVASQDPLIKYYAQQVQQKVLQGEKAAGVGTAGTVGEKEVNEALRVMKGIYDATRLTKMVYSETGAGTSKFGDNTTSTEHIRLAREVVTGNTGLCIELALLHASVLKAAGNHAVIFLIPGHAYPGILLGNTYYALEATGIGGEGLGSIMTAQQAYETGEKELDEFFAAYQKGTPGYNILDIDRLSDEGYKEMELKDDPFLRQKIDQLTQSFQASYTPAQPEEPVQNEEQTAETTGNTVGSTSNNGPAMATHSGNINFGYPASWTRKDHPVPQLPILVTMFSSPGAKNGAVEIYEVPATNAAQAMGYIQQSLSRLGVQIKYVADGQQNGLIRYNGMSAYNGSTIHWESFLRPVNGGIEGVVVGSAPNSNLTATHQKIINTVN